MKPYDYDCSCYYYYCLDTIGVLHLSEHPNTGAMWHTISPCNECIILSINLFFIGCMSEYNVHWIGHGGLFHLIHFHSFVFLFISLFMLLVLLRKDLMCLMSKWVCAHAIGRGEKVCKLKWQPKEVAGTHNTNIYKHDKNEAKWSDVKKKKAEIIILHAHHTCTKWKSNICPSYTE